MKVCGLFGIQINNTMMNVWECFIELARWTFGRMSGHEELWTLNTAVQGEPLCIFIYYYLFITD